MNTLNENNNITKTTHFWVLFLFEALLKLSINVIQISLVFYVINLLGKETSIAYGWLGLFGVMLYSIPIIIGKFVDEFIGLEKSVKLGVSLLFLGSGILFIERETFFIFGMAFIALGSSFFKPNLIVILDKMFPDKNSQRNKYFSYFYLSSNVGGLLSTILVGITTQFFNLNKTIAVAQVSLLVLSVLFLIFQGKLKKYYSVKPEVGVKLHKNKIIEIFLVFLSLFLCIYYRYSEILLMFSSLILAKMVWDYKKYILEKKDTNLNSPILRIFITVLYAIVFFSLTSQIYYSFNLFLKHYVDRSISQTFNIPVAWFFSINPLLIIVLGSVISKNIRNINLINRMILSFLLVMIAYSLFYTSIILGDEKAYFGWVVLAFIFFVAAEILIIPHLISEITYNIPSMFKSRIVGFWYMTMAFAQYLSSKIAVFICPDIVNTTFKGFSLPILKIIIVINIIVFLIFSFRDKINKIIHPH